MYEKRNFKDEVPSELTLSNEEIDGVDEEELMCDCCKARVWFDYELSGPPVSLCDLARKALKAEHDGGAVYSLACDQAFFTVPVYDDVNQSRCTDTIVAKRHAYDWILGMLLNGPVKREEVEMASAIMGQTLDEVDTATKAFHLRMTVAMDGNGNECEYWALPSEGDFRLG